MVIADGDKIIPPETCCVCFVFVGVKTDHILFPKYVETHINECVAEISLNAEIV